jgi:hypothetical protein
MFTKYNTTIALASTRYFGFIVALLLLLCNSNPFSAATAIRSSPSHLLQLDASRLPALLPPSAQPLPATITPSESATGK